MIDAVLAEDRNAAVYRSLARQRRLTPFGRNAIFEVGPPIKASRSCNAGLRPTTLGDEVGAAQSYSMVYKDGANVV